ncbi:type I-E CRISPR-associated protein Cas7/Cse4/CasC [Arthrobacter sp. HMSC08H08]|uniref:type I-E CRISPR-associated protein Cas7/Cse4/CasC n=1 Tax=Arthrobacter sp. HMSC08H08 TaxID=1581143 RepID=UPI0008A3F46A|nr:type I-E CRISPR-associated protein Cas7/Cse4/CasC [Arthrobacter sp. HMSC08H08]OFT23185.1 hypothetical protein HMPREF3175_05930 [Arthrobacter sp. HMSC08H08]
MTRTIIDIHALQTVPPSNLNRDETGSPKTALFGGVTRARVSSQAWKRATRVMFRDIATDDLLGVRTKKVVALLASKMLEIDPDIAQEQAEAAAIEIVTAAGIKVAKPKGRKEEGEKLEETGYLIFLSTAQATNLAQLGVDALSSGDVTTFVKDRENKKNIRAAAVQDASVDVSLFGRMVADDASLNIDAAAQVAHAISVHDTPTEADYFTAVDDIREADEDGGEDAGAAMIGTIEFNSSTLYRYATVDANALAANLGNVEATRIGVEAFVRAFLTSMPSGKMNTFANRTLPEVVVVQVRDSQSVNLVGAFEEPVRGTHISDVAAARLAAWSLKIDEKYGTTPVKSWVISLNDGLKELDELGEATSLEGLVTALGGTVESRLEA